VNQYSHVSNPSLNLLLAHFLFVISTRKANCYQAAFRLVCRWRRRKHGGFVQHIQVVLWGLSFLSFLLYLVSFDSRFYFLLVFCLYSSSKSLIVKCGSVFGSLSIRPLVATNSSDRGPIYFIHRVDSLLLPIPNTASCLSLV